jgi:hypothetical protein
MLIKAKTQWNWFCQMNNRMKCFLIFLYDKHIHNNSIDILTSYDYQHNDNGHELRLDLEQFGFYRRGLPFPVTDEEIEWFNKKPELIEHIARIVLDEFSQKRLCCRKFKVRIQVYRIFRRLYLINLKILFEVSCTFDRIGIEKT